jgi:hypothetical protein
MIVWWVRQPRNRGSIPVDRRGLPVLLWIQAGTATQSSLQWAPEDSYPGGKVTMAKADNLPHFERMEVNFRSRICLYGLHT